MKHYTIVFLLFVLLIFERADAQWNIVASNLFGPHSTPYGGVITFKDGIVWAGINQLFNSLDSGKTWNMLVNPVADGQISEITFLDKDTGAILYIDYGVYLTEDGAKTWRHIITLNECFGLSFARNGKELFVGERANLHGTSHYTSDGGLTWSQQQIEGSGGGVYDAAYSPHSQKAYLLSRYITPSRSSHINVSTDFGQTWQRQSDIDLDCYSIALDSCTSSKVYLGNEEYDDATNGLSEIFVSSNDGKSWSSNVQGGRGFFSSSFSCTASTIYTGSSLGQGIFRSIDHGSTWKSIGGPSPHEDTRLLCAINDNIILVADPDGNIWRTINSGGDSITNTISSGSLRFSISSGRVINDSLGVTVRLPIYLQASAAMPSLDMVIHYPVYSLTYQKSVALSGADIDVAGGAWAGRAAVHFEATELTARKDSLIGYAIFSWYPYEYECAHITFDSLSVVVPDNPCSGKIAVSDTASEGIIGSFPSCGKAIETDVDAPEFQVKLDMSNGSNGIYGTDTLVVNDGRSTDEGLRSITWRAQIGTDTNKIKVLPITPPILSCYTDKINHIIQVVQLDTSAYGCYDFTFTDCLGHQSYDTICMGTPKISAVGGGESFQISLEANHPNPFSHVTTFTFTISDYSQVRLYLYDVLGKEVARITDGNMPAGSYSKDFDGSKLPSGNYIMRLECGGKVVSRRVVVER